MVNYLYQIMQDTSSLDQVNVIHTLQSYVSYSHIIATYTQHLDMLLKTLDTFKQLLHP